MLFLSAVAKVLPVFLLILTGVLLRRIGFLHPSTVADLKKLIVNVTLPAALFLAFSSVDVGLGDLAIVAIVFGACLAVLLLGRPLGRALRVQNPYFAYLISGFEAGMLGYAIFGAVYGAENLYKFGIVDLGQVLFVFIVLVPGLQRLQHTGAAQPLSRSLVKLLQTPVILAIVAGLLFNRLGLTALFSRQPLLDGLLEALRLAGAMTTPLVALAIGYELQMRPGALRDPLVTTAARLLIWLPLGYLFARFVVGGWLGRDTISQAAVMAMVLLPAPFVIPIFLRRKSSAPDNTVSAADAGGADDEDANAVVNTLTLGTLVTLAAYAFVPLFFPPG
jgi:predicted permease